jgi:hypothetical protein
MRVLRNTLKHCAFPISATLWKNQTAEGKAFYSVTFARTHKDKGGQSLALG